jgi:hypothetical protein
MDRSLIVGATDLGRQSAQTLSEQISRAVTAVLAQRGGLAGRAGHRRLLRDGTLLVKPVRANVAAEIRRGRVERMKGFTHRRWHLDEVYVKINGEMH